MEWDEFLISSVSIESLSLCLVRAIKVIEMSIKKNFKIPIE